MTRRRLLIGGGAATVAIIALLIFLLWWFVLRDDAPAAVNLPAAVSSIEDDATATAEPATATEASPDDTATATPTPTAASPDAGADAATLDGVWTLAERGESFAGYRVEEELATIGYKEAVGRTSGIEASVTIAGGELAAATITVDLRGLRSDDSRRDGALRRQALETDAFPTATFALEGPLAIPAGLAAGEAIAMSASGAFTLHGVTRAVAIPLEAELANGLLVVVGSLPVLFADYDIDQPRSPILVSIEDNGVMEFQLVLARGP